MKNKKQQLREEISRRIRNRIGYLNEYWSNRPPEKHKTWADYVIWDLESLFEKALSQQKEEVRREVLERLRGLLLVDDWQPLYSEALSEVNKKSLIEELEKSLETK